MGGVIQHHRVPLTRLVGHPRWPSRLVRAAVVRKGRPSLADTVSEVEVLWSWRSGKQGSGGVQVVKDEGHFKRVARPVLTIGNRRLPGKKIHIHKRVQRLERLVAALPLKCRQAFLLNRVDGLDFATIARTMNLSERMVRVYVERAILHCRQRMDLEEN
jgi:Sigma-70, region 4